MKCLNSALDYWSMLGHLLRMALIERWNPQPRFRRNYILALLSFFDSACFKIGSLNFPFSRLNSKQTLPEILTFRYKSEKTKLSNHSHSILSWIMKYEWYRREDSKDYRFELWTFNSETRAAQDRSSKRKPRELLKNIVPAKYRLGSNSVQPIKRAGHYFENDSLTNDSWMTSREYFILRLNRIALRVARLLNKNTVVCFTLTSMVDGANFPFSIRHPRLRAAFWRPLSDPTPPIPPPPLPL